MRGFGTNRSDDDSCKELLKLCEMFFKVTDDHLSAISRLMKYKTYQRNQVMLTQGEPSDRFFLLDTGEIRRLYESGDGKVHNVEYAIKAKSIGSMKVLSMDPVFATVKCVSDECKVFELMRSDLIDLLRREPEIATEIAIGLCETVRTGTRKYQTPLLEQQQQEINIPVVAIAAGIESYYRSALNAMLNASLTGVKAELFPNMHIQVPTRIAYITGFKGLRTMFERLVEPDQYDSPNIVRLATAIAPGIAMTPISSILEASNAGHMNPEPITTRWMRGILPRGGREIIFGIGLNQMSDYFEERFQPFFKDHPLVANAAGSLAAGVVSGYLSHVPHNLSTFKLMEPQKSYSTLFRMFVDKSVPTFVDRATHSWPPSAQFATRAAFATMFPKGVVIRTAQIVGSFMILNGTINYLQTREHMKIEKALGLK